MKKTDCTTVKLSTGAVSVYDFGTAKLHAYQTNDPLADEVFVVEKDGKGVVLEYPPFVANIEELGGYIAEQGIEIEGIVAAYHMAGASFLPGTPVFATKEADEYGHAGGGKALIDGFATAFGASFNASVPEAVTYIEGDELELAGVKMGIVRNDDAFDIEIPELNAVYTHMLGHDCHSIVAGAGHADAIIKYPFWELCARNERSVYVCVNRGEAWAPKEIRDRSILVDADIARVLEDLGDLGEARIA